MKREELTRSGCSREIRRASERGRIDLSDALFTELEQRGRYELVHRSGSF